MDIISGLAAVGNAVSIAQGLRSIEKKYDEATMTAKLAELMMFLSDAKFALSDARDALAEKDREIERLKASFEVSVELVKGDGDYLYYKQDNLGPVGYPVCPKCQPIDNRVIQLKQDGHSGRATCPSCRITFEPVTCYLQQGSGYRTVAEKEEAEWNAQTRATNNRGFV